MDGEADVTRRGLNIMEALILTALVALVGAVLYQGKAMVELQTVMGFMRDDVKGLRAQQADVPNRVSRLEVEMEQVKKDQDELRSVKGLK